MYGFVLPNAQGLQIDLYGKIFLLWLGIGSSTLVFIYYRWKYIRTKKAICLQEKNTQALDHLRTHIYTKGGSSDQKIIRQFVAYLEKFTTKQQSYSRESLLREDGFSQEEIRELHEVYYGQASLSSLLKEKVQAKMA